MDVERLTFEELSEEYGAFEDFASIYGDQYFNEAGRARRAALQDELARRTAEMGEVPNLRLRSHRDYLRAPRIADMRAILNLIDSGEAHASGVIDGCYTGK